MRSLRDLPIKHKLTLISMVTSGAALLLACGSFMSYEQITYRHEMARDLSITARMIGFNCAAALSFNDAASAEQTLKGLNVEPHIVAACVYDMANHTFATYNSAAGVNYRWPVPRGSGEEFGPDSLEIFQKIESGGEKIGTIYVRSNLEEIHALWRRYAAIAAVVLLVAILVAWLVATKLQRVISEPVRQLAAIASRVTAEKDYSIRAIKRGDDELGRLIDGFNAMLGEIQRREGDLQAAQDGLERRVQERTEALRIEVKERENLHRQLLETSRQAGMAEVATGVLHNVGNVLNSVNVSATLVADRMRRSKSANVGKVSVLLGEHEADIAAYLTGDPNGKMIPAYLATLAEQLAEEQAAVFAELEHLRKNIEHIKDIVSMQQSYAKTSGVVETVSVPDLVEDALRMNAGSLARHDVDVVREYRDRPVVTLEKHKVLQILVNLIRNAKYACDESGRVNKQLTVKLTADDRGVSIAIIDNGVGILAENLTRIFAHGFTTRKTGHGFGLHNGAIAAKELGGSISVHSDGPDQGATFTLSLPYKPNAIIHDKSPS